MGVDSFTLSDPIFEDEDVLRDEHTPEQLIERDEELRQFQAALKPVVNGARPRNIFLYGQAGVGKTLASRMVLDQLERDVAESVPGVDVEVVWLTAKSMNTSYQVAARLVNEFRPPDDPKPTKGLPPAEVYSNLWTELNDTDATHTLIVLDEVDSIGSDDDILYEVPRCNDNGNVTETKVGVIGISNDFTFRDNLSGRVKDSLCDKEIHFPPYNATELRNILEQRAEKAFVSGDVVSDDVVPLCAAFAGQESGSARQALKLLFEASDLARQEADRREDDEEYAPKVCEEHVREAEPIIRENKIERELERLPTQSHLTLAAMLEMSDVDDLPARSADIYSEYERVAQTVSADVKTIRTIRDRLSQLTLKGFLAVAEQNKGVSGGSYFKYSFGDVDEQMIRSVLAETDRLDDVYG